MDFKAFVVKLQNLPETHKKIVLWTIVGVLALAMGFFWFKGAMSRLSQIGSEVGQINFPQIQMPEIENRVASDVDQTAGWQTYKNDEYGFEIKIPPEWIVEKKEWGLSFTTEELRQDYQENQICLNDRLENCDAGELPYAIASFEYLLKDADKYSSTEIEGGITVIELSGIKWYRYVSGGMLWNAGFRTLDNNGKGYRFNVYWEEDEPIFKQALSTFKFLE